MQDSAPIDIEVITVYTGCYAVVVGGTCVAEHPKEADALAHCERLRQQATEQTSEQINVH